VGAPIGWRFKGVAVEMIVTRREAVATMRDKSTIGEFYGEGANAMIIAWTRLVTSALAALIFTPLLAAQQTANIRSYSSPPGKLVDIGGWRVHINCTGQNRSDVPAVVLEAGALGFSFDWSLVQPGVARFARVCSYDRAGHAWSDSGPTPRTMKQVAYELHTALARLNVNPPYVLVGHSAGGLRVRTFASLYPDEIAGMALVDSDHEDSMRNFKGKRVRVRELSGGRTVPPIQISVSDVDKTLSAEERQRIETFLKRTGPLKITPPFDRLTPRIQKMRLWALAQPQHYASNNDNSFFETYAGEEYAEIYSARKAKDYPLGDIPLIVLTRGASEFPDTDDGRRDNEERKSEQLNLLQLSRNSKQRIAELSGHNIQLEDPALVIDAIREVVSAIMRHQKLRP
jgi:pimeloyl-ACP methyl ester carboxylesterase